MKKSAIIGLFIFLLSLLTVLSAEVFDFRPEKFQPKFEVSACFIEVGNQVFFIKRHPDVSQGNTWAIPGGKVKRGEGCREAVIREVFEETGIIVTAQDLDFERTVYIRYPNYDYLYHIFNTTLNTKPHIRLNLEESTNYRWLTRDEVDELDHQNLLIPDEMPCIERVYGQGEFDRNYSSGKTFALRKAEGKIELRNRWNRPAIRMVKESRTDYLEE